MGTMNLIYKCNGKIGLHRNKRINVSRFCTMIGPPMPKLAFDIEENLEEREKMMNF